MSTLIIAEAGVNHNGDLSTAKRLIDVAASAGVDFVKFQTFKADRIVTKDAQKARYQKDNVSEGDTQYEMLRKLELSEEFHLKLIKHAKDVGVRFFSTGFDMISLDYLHELGLPMFKVPSGELTNYPYLRKIGSFRKPVILSTGMASLPEIKEAVDVVCMEGLKKRDITVLHCNTEYPTPMKDVNLKAMITIADSLNVNIGYSDHTLGIEVPIAAVAMGAMVIEKHFTLDRNLPGPDHRASLEPEELQKMVRGIRNIELAVSGNGEKKPSESESKNKNIVRKSIYLSKAMAKNEIIHEDDLICLRPGDGITPMLWEQIIGRTINSNLPEFHKLSFDDLKEQDRDKQK